MEKSKKDSKDAKTTTPSRRAKSSKPVSNSKASPPKKTSTLSSQGTPDYDSESDSPGASPNTRYGTKSKNLPENFHEKVIELEMAIDKGQLEIENINELIRLYAQAVEYYNGHNDDKFTFYTDKIQTTLMKPEILKVMSIASQDPAKYKKEQEEKKKRKEELMSQLDQNEARRIEHIQQEKKKKERMMQLAVNMEEVKMQQNGSDGKLQSKAELLVEDQEEKASKAQLEVKHEIQQQNDALEKKLALRRNRQKMKRSMNNSAIDDGNNSGYDPSKGLSPYIIKKQQPMTVKGNFMFSTKRAFANIEDELNEISMIKDSTNFETNQMNEESFNMDLLKQIGVNQIQLNTQPKKSPLFIDGFEEQENFNFEGESELEEERYQDQLKEIWENCDQMIEELQKEMQEEIEKVLEQYAQNKFEKKAEIKSSYDFLIKRLEQAKQKNPEKIKSLQQKRDEEIKQSQEELELEKKQSIEQIKKDFELKKKAKQGEKDVHLSQIKFRGSANRSLSRINTLHQTPSNQILGRFGEDEKDVSHVHQKKALATSKGIAPKQFLFADKSPLPRKHVNSSNSLNYSDSKNSLINLKKVETEINEDLALQIDDDNNSPGFSPHKKLELEDIQILSPVEGNVSLQNNKSESSGGKKQMIRKQLELQIAEENEEEEHDDN